MYSIQGNMPTEGWKDEVNYISWNSESKSRITELTKLIKTPETRARIFDCVKRIRGALERKGKGDKINNINCEPILERYKGKYWSDWEALWPNKVQFLFRDIELIETTSQDSQHREAWEMVLEWKMSPNDFVKEWLSKEKERDRGIVAGNLIVQHFFGNKRKGNYNNVKNLLEIFSGTNELTEVYNKLLDDSMGDKDWKILEKFVNNNEEAISIFKQLKGNTKWILDNGEISNSIALNKFDLIVDVANKYGYNNALPSGLIGTLSSVDDVDDKVEMEDITNMFLSWKNEAEATYIKGFIDKCVEVLKKRSSIEEKLVKSIENFFQKKGEYSINRNWWIISFYKEVLNIRKEDMNNWALSSNNQEYDGRLEEIYKNWKINRIDELINIDLWRYASAIAFAGSENGNIASLLDAKIWDVDVCDYSRNEHIAAAILKYKRTKSKDAVRTLWYFAQSAFPWKKDQIQIWIRWEGIECFLNQLRKESKFSDYAEDIELILKQSHPNWEYPQWDGYVSTEEAEKGIVKEFEKWIETLNKLWVTFDSQEVQRALYGVRPHARPGLSPYFNQTPRTTEEYQTKHRFDFISQNTEKRFITSVKDLSDDRVESIIPEEEYLYGIKLKWKLENQWGWLIDFLWNCKDLPDIYKRSPWNIILAKAIMNSKNTSLSIEGVDQSLLDQIKADWFDWGCKWLIESYKRHLWIHINFFAWETALWVREGMLNSILKGKLHFEVKDIPNPHPDKIDRDIFYFTDTGNSAYRENPYYPVYGFNPKTGEIFIEKQWINKEAWKISLWEGGVMREKIADIPPYSIFMWRISVNDILPNTRPSSYEESVENLADEISNKMAFAFSEVKGKEIEENLLQSRYKGEILDKAKTLLGIIEDTEEIMEDQPAKYQLLTTIINTMENISSEDMNQLNIFLDNIKQYYWKNEGMQNMTSNPSIFSYFSMYANSSDLSKEGWESESFEKNRVFREWSGKTSLKPSETKLWRFFSFLYKRKGENPNSNNIDPTLTSDLITKDNLEMRMLDIGKIRYLNQNMSKDIWNISWTTQLEQWWKYMKKTLYAPYELDAIETEIQWIPD